MPQMPRKRTRRDVGVGEGRDVSVVSEGSHSQAPGDLGAGSGSDAASVRAEAHEHLYDLTPEIVGELLAQAFHRGLEAGKQMGIEVMRKAAVEHCDKRRKTKALFGNMELVAEEIGAISFPLDTVKL